LNTVLFFFYPPPPLPYLHPFPTRRSSDLATKDELPSIVLETPKEKAHGDFATNIAMQLASIAKKAPRAIAEDIVKHLDLAKASVEKIDIAGPGFINFFMKRDFLGDII